MPTEDEVRTCLSSLGAEKVTVSDISDGCGAKFSLVIISSKFEGIPLLQRQRLVNSLLPMDDIHAVQMKTWTVTQAAKKGFQL